jgi:hypothetical protein
MGDVAEADDGAGYKLPGRVDACGRVDDALADLQDDDGVEPTGAEVLSGAIEYVGQEWLSGVGRVPDSDKPLRYYTTVRPDETRPGLGVVYDWFVDALKGSPYQDFALEIRARWRARVAAGRWPKFTAS